MAGGLRKLGAAFVEIFADKKRLEADIKSAQQTVEQSTQEMGKSVEENVTRKFDDSLKPVRKIRETLSFVLGTLAAIAGSLAGIAKLSIEWSRAALGVNKAYSDSLTTLRELQKQTQKMRDEISGIFDSQAAEIAEIRNAIAKLGAETAKQQQENAGFIEKVLDPSKIDNTSTSLIDNLAKTWGAMLRDASGATGVMSGFIDDIDKAAQAQRDTIDKGVNEAIRANRELEKEAIAKRIKDEEEATARLAEKNAQTYRELWSAIAAKDLEQLQAYYDKANAEASALHAQRMDNDRREHEARMRAIDEYRKGITGINTALGGLRRIGELPKLLKDIKNAI